MRKSLLAFTLLAFVALIYQGCGEFSSTAGAPISSRVVDVDSEALILQGKTLYAESCAGCHGPIDTSTKLGRTAGQINAAISDVAQMQSLRATLSEDMIEAIGAALEFEANGGGLSLNPDGRLRFACTPGAISRTPLLKLSNREYRNAIHAFLDGFSTTLKNDAQLRSLLDNLPTDVLTMDRSTLKEQPRLTSQLGTLGSLNVAYRAAELISGQTTVLNSLPGTNNCLAQTAISANCHLRLITSLAPIAFRRPLTSAELNTLSTQLYDSSLSRNNQLLTTLTALMQWPDFQYKTFIHGTPVAGEQGLIALSPHELAQRLSFLITGAPADATLLALTNSGAILQEAQLEQQADRLLASALGQQNLVRFFRESYGYDVFDNFSYPASFLEGVNTSGLREAMVQELDNYFTHLVINENATFTDLMTSRYANITHPGLRTIYQTTSSGAMTLPAVRSGFINRAATLTKRSGVLSSPIKRGLEILEHVLCVEVGQPPPSAPTSLPNLGNQLLTTRARTQATSEAPGSTCVACHGRFNPLGYALESFDTLGRFRSEERIFDGNGNLRGTLPVNTQAASEEIHSRSTSFANSVDLVRELANSQKAQLCLVRHLKKFESRNSITSADNCQMNAIADGLQGDLAEAGSFRGAIRKFVTSEQFRYWSH